MNEILDLIIKVIIGVVGAILTALVLRIYNDVRLLVKRGPTKYTHLRYEINREKFNKLGIEILNGSVANDTVYVILRTGTFIKDFSNALAKFRQHSGTKLIVIVPDKKVFMSNFGKALSNWITELYENKNCAGVRALILKPGATMPNETRMAGYLFVSDGHNDDDDDGFYTATPHSKKFLLGYIEALRDSGTKVNLPKRQPKTRA